jgi:septum formation protein
VSDFLYLASQSPRRRQLLEQLGVRYELLLPDEHEDAESIETVLSFEAPATYVQRVTGLKLDMAVQRLKRRGLPPAPILCSDTAVAVGGARKREQALSVSRVSFAPLSPREIKRYVASGEPLGKAGAYAVQGRAAVFISKISGSYTGIMGLPLFETAQLLNNFGFKN